MKKNRYKKYSHKTIIIGLTLFLLLTMGVGYSVFSTHLDIDGSIGVEKYDHTLYGVFEKEFRKGSIVIEYTGSHKDSFTQTGNKKIYHWYAATQTQATQVLNKNNVIFANHCWQMIRTTDTGGVKMIYNGEVEDGKCLDTRGTHIGYLSQTRQSLSSNYWYGTDYIYDSSLQLFRVSGQTEQVRWDSTTGPGLIGKYTCKSTDVSGTCSTIYLIESYSDSSSGYVIPIEQNSHYSQFGELDFNPTNDSISYVGYMYNTVYPTVTKKRLEEPVLDYRSISTNYWYADDISWNSSTRVYSLVNPYQITSTDDYSNLVGKYTLIRNDQNAVNSYAYYIVGVSGSTMYYILLRNETNSTHDLSYYNNTYTYGDSYTDNGNGTYTINNPATISTIDWYNELENMGDNKYVCKNAVNNTCSDLWYEISAVSYRMNYLRVTNLYKYSNSFTWDGSKYILDDDTSVSFWNLHDSTNQDLLKHAHYTCFNSTGECTTISYVFQILSWTTGDSHGNIISAGEDQIYINLQNGKNIETALNEMLFDSNVNSKNSMIKTGIDAWYAHFLLDYDEYLEDTIFCNDRSIQALNGMDPNGGGLNNLYFSNHDIGNSLECTNVTDQFSVSNNSAKLTHKVGLMTGSEMRLLGDYHVRKTGKNYWIFAASTYNSGDAYSYFIKSDGVFESFTVSFDNGVRPAISIKPGIVYTDGDGSMENPYTIESD
ncbi:MAG: hypothetical protein J6X28_04095 [Bacilli bacterium]|nr:hypothetical protein [Bacilli bacterium]